MRSIVGQFASSEQKKKMSQGQNCQFGFCCCRQFPTSYTSVEMPNLKFTASPGRRGRKAIVDGFMFTRHRAATPPKPTQWQCSRRPCPARLKIDANEQQYEVLGEHNHLPDFGASKAASVVANIRKRARETVDVTPSRITQQALGRVDSETAAALPP